MAYTVLARKYRSQTFDDVVGQEPIAQTLKNAIKTNRVAHAYLFTGTRGVGKTTMARILFFHLLLIIIYILLYKHAMDREELKKGHKDFAHRCVKLAMALPNTAIGRHIRIQLIRCSTSAAANYRAACIAQIAHQFCR